MNVAQEKRRVLVTGATGFIGSRCVRHLQDSGHEVVALVRATSDTSCLEGTGCELAVADLAARPDVLAPALDRALQGIDWVVHLAAKTKAVRSATLIEHNVTVMENVLQAMVRVGTPRLVLVSSLAASGPSTETQPLVEGETEDPASCYGKSKLACESLAREYADRILISVVRPPIVLGERDRHGLLMFQSIEAANVHFIPGFRRRIFSLIHVDDLCRALEIVAAKGKALKHQSQDDHGTGIYFAAAPESFSFADLGTAIGRAMGKRPWRIPVAFPLLWGIAFFNELKGRLVGREQYLNVDKLKEATAGSWWCSSEKMKTELGFEPEVPIAERLKQIVTGYRALGWLKPGVKTRSQVLPQPNRHKPSGEQSMV